MDVYNNCLFHIGRTEKTYSKQFLMFTLKCQTFIFFVFKVRFFLLTKHMVKHNNFKIFHF